MKPVVADVIAAVAGAREERIAEAGGAMSERPARRIGGRACQRGCEPDCKQRYREAPRRVNGR